MTTTKTVTIKKAKRSTFIQNKRHLTTHRIGDINVVDWRWCLPGDVFRYKVSHAIKADALLAPAFARMKVYTDLFYVSIKSIMPDFYEKIPNFDQQQKTSMKNGKTETTTPYYFPHENIDLIRLALSNTGNRSAAFTTSDILPNGTQLNSSTLYYYGGTWNNTFANFISTNGDFVYTDYPDDNYNILHWDAVNRYDISQLCSQMGFPAVATRVGSKQDIGSYLLSSPTSNINELNHLPWFDGNLADYISLGFGKDFSSLSSIDRVSAVQGKIENVNFSTLPFKAYQKIYNEWFINSLTTHPVDLFPNIVTWLSGTDFLKCHFVIQAGTSNTFTYDTAYIPNNRALLYLNSLFRIRKCWYAKDYFNTASNDSHLVQGQNIGSTVLDLRKANALQRLLEKRALVGGNRFFDFVAQHWNFFPDNLELDRPLHLGSDTDFINIGEVLQTSESTQSSPQGERAGTANAFSRGRGVLFNSPDYGILMCLSRIVPEIDYFSGLERKWNITNTSHWPLPELAQIGFQSIYNSEVSVLQSNFERNSARNDTAFGYAPRYSEWKDAQNQISGEMQTSRRYWHQSPGFDFSRPGLNTYFGRVGFYEEGASNMNSTPYMNPENSYLNNIFAISDNMTTNHFVAMYNIECTVNRALPSNDMPQL